MSETKTKRGGCLIPLACWVGSIILFLFSANTSCNIPVEETPFEAWTTLVLSGVLFVAGIVVFAIFPRKGGKEAKTTDDSQQDTTKGKSND